MLLLIEKSKLYPMDINSSNNRSKFLFGGLSAVLLLLVISLATIWGSNPPVITNTPAVSGIISDNLYQVVKVIDGDTITINFNSKQEKVRLLGIDTPELKNDQGKVDCYAYEAKRELDSRLQGEKVKLEFDQSQGQYDKYQRLLAYVYRASDGLFLNEELLQIGAAREYTYDKPYRYQSEFRQLQSRAKIDSSGLWGTCITG